MCLFARLSAGSMIAAQLLLVVTGIGAMALLPPATGRMLLVPLRASGAAEVVPLALAGDARLVARGPLAGSIIVDGQRDRLAGFMIRHGILVLGAPFAICGSTR